MYIYISLSLSIYIFLYSYSGPQNTRNPRLSTPKPENDVASQPQALNPRVLASGELHREVVACQASGLLSNQGEKRVPLRDLIMDL